jgi:glycine/D-amino acid oxidase-like deaminating enzyme
VLIVGGGLAGGLLALELRERGCAVTLLDGADATGAGGHGCATALSYGGIPGWPVLPTPLARRAAAAARRWRQLQRRHGDLGWRRCGLRLHGAALAPWLRWLPFSRVDAVRLRDRLPQVLAAAGVEQRAGRALALEPLAGGAWRVRLTGGESLEAPQLVLAAGAGCRALWPDLPPQLRCSWAGVLQLPSGGGPITLPRHWQRPLLERRAPQLQEAAWVVDPGRAPWGDGALLGQISWLAAVDAADGSAPDLAPDPARMEHWLRQGLAACGAPWTAALEAAGPYHQVPVAFCSNGLPLVGPVPQAPGLWAFSGFSGAFAQVPVLAPLLADWLAAEPRRSARARRRLQALGL